MSAKIPEEILCQLKKRGITIHRANPDDFLLFPSSLSQPNKEKFYHKLKRYSFRLFVRDMIKKREKFSPKELTHYCSLSTARLYIKFLEQIEVIKEIKRGYYRLVVDTSSFGSTLEWFLSQVYIKEFCSPAIYGVRFKDIPAGGDFDVISSWLGNLIYTEAKASPPKGIEINEVNAFFKRIDELLPDVALFVNDTQLRMKDKIVFLFEEGLKRRFGEVKAKDYKVARLKDELFHINHHIFIVNSHRDLIKNIMICLKDFFRNFRLWRVENQFKK